MAGGKKDKEPGGVKVTDKRRFDYEGSLKKEAEQDPAPESPEVPKEGGEKIAQGPEETGGEKKAAPMPPMDFATFIFSLSTTAQFHLGEIADPATGKFEKNIQLAKQTIDIIGMLQKKTKGNLTDDEQKLLESLLYSLRMSYVSKGKE